MILYHAISAYQLLNCIIHKLSLYPSEKAVLILPDFIVSKYAKYEDLVKYNIFSEIYLFPYGTIQYNLNAISKSVEAAVRKTLPYPIDKFDEIYIGGVHFPFTIYLIEKQIRFHYFEDASGLLSRPEIVRNTIKDKYPEHTAIADQYGLFHPNGYLIKSKICKVNAQSDNYVDDKMVDFDVMRQFPLISEIDQMNIQRFFGCPQTLNLPSQSVVILTQHFSNLGVMNFENQVTIYQLFVDYFFENCHLVFKPHPDDSLYYEYLFPDAHVIRERFPSEFLPFIFERRPKILATISSTAMNNLVDYFDETMQLDVSFEKHYKGIHAIYTTLRCISSIYSEIILQINTRQMALFRNLIKYSLLATKKFKIADDSLKSNVIIFDMDEICDTKYSNSIIHILDELDENQIACFVNCNYDVGFYNLQRKDIWNYIIPIVMKKNIVKGEDHYSDCENEVIYFYSKNRKIQEMIAEFNMKKELKYSGITLSVESSNQRDQRILILEGLLAATEKRLNHYIKREAELLKYIDEHNWKEYENENCSISTNKTK